MDINIRISNYDYSNYLRVKVEETLLDKYGNYPFITSMFLQLSKNENNHKVTLRLHLKNSSPIFAEASFEKKLNIALKNAITKVNRQLEKYKQLHYKSLSKIKK